MRAVATGASAPCTFATFATLVAPAFGWDMRCDAAIVQALNAAAVSLRCSPYNVQCADAVAACLPALNSVLASRASRDRTPLAATAPLQRSAALLARVSFLKQWNDAAERLLPFCDLSVGYVSQHEALRAALARLRRSAAAAAGSSTGGNASSGAVPGWGTDSLDLNAVALRGTIFAAAKEALLKRALERSATKTRKASDEYDYPDDLPQLQLNRHKSATSIALNVRSKLVGGTSAAVAVSAHGAGAQDIAVIAQRANGHATLGPGMSLFEGASAARVDGARAARGGGGVAGNRAGDTSVRAVVRPGVAQLELAPIANARATMEDGRSGGTFDASGAVGDAPSTNSSLEDELRLAQSLFGQIFEELHYADPSTLRLGASPPLPSPLEEYLAPPPAATNARADARTLIHRSPAPLAPPISSLVLSSSPSLSHAFPPSRRLLPSDGRWPDPYVQSKV